MRCFTGKQSKVSGHSLYRPRYGIPTLNSSCNVTQTCHSSQIRTGFRTYISVHTAGKLSSCLQCLPADLLLCRRVPFQSCHVEMCNLPAVARLHTCSSSAGEALPFHDSYIAFIAYLHPHPWKCLIQCLSHWMTRLHQAYKGHAHIIKNPREQASWHHKAGIGSSSGHYDIDVITISTVCKQ